jgi:NADPH-dependent glutamate synthase beta subunit-like oxidoreductase
MSDVLEIETGGVTTEMREELLHAAHQCLECGKCTGSCPIVELFPNDFHPHHLLLDMVHKPETALKGHNLWLCASCYKCNKRCPQALEFPYIIMKMRALALKENGTEPLTKAYGLIRETIPFPTSFMSVCIHPERIDLDPALLDKLHQSNLSRKIEKYPVTDRKVAIVGSGPAGLTCAFELRKLGYGVSIYESKSHAGGMFSLAIPEYRVPLGIVQDEIEQMKKLGINFVLDTRIGEEPSLEQLFKEGYAAIFLAIGAHGCKKMDLQGEDQDGVYDSLEFLEVLKIGKKDIKGKNVVVVGGGNTAMDAACSAMKYGAKEALVLYRRTREEMPADINEIREAEEDGVQIRFLESPLCIHGEKSRVKQLECLKMELGEPDLSGRRRPVPKEDSHFTLDTDIVVIAIGEQPDIQSFPDAIAAGRNDTILINPSTMETNIPRVFAAGDGVSGPATVPEAIIGARRAARGIDNLIQSS